MPNHVEKYDYHGTYGTPTLLRRTLDGTAYDFNMTYDAEGRLDVLTYPTSTTGYRFAVDYDYDAFGHMSSVRESGGSGTTFYTLTEADALGREVNVGLGNGLTEYRTFDRASGYLKNIETGPALSASIQNLSFTFDEVGNVKTRTNGLTGKTETFVYDALNRLTSTQVTGLAAVNVAYSAAGRITSKSDYGGTYTYSTPTRPYAVTSAGGQSYAYDAAGRMTTHGADTFTWHPYDLPKMLAVGTKSSEFFYGVGRDRYKQIQKTGSTTDATIYYVGTLFEKEVAATTTYRHYVEARGRTVAAVNRVGTTNTVQYLHRDRQGSVVEVTGSSGALVQSLAFDAWGLRRNPATWAALGSPFGGTEPTERGYTGHEHLDRVELIHMNGRVQDPRLGRFISADPLVQAPYHGQSLNRYSYVWNNPASLVDPSGFQTVPDFDAPPPAWDSGLPNWTNFDPQGGLAGTYRVIELPQAFYLPRGSYWEPSSGRPDMQGAAAAHENTGGSFDSDDQALSAFIRGFSGEERSLMLGEAPFAERFGRGVREYGGAALTGATVATGVGGIVRYGVARLVAARGATSIIGRSFGRLGTVVENPGIKIRGFAGSVEQGHAVNAAITRGVSPQLIRDTVANPTVVLQQAGGRYLYLTDQAAVAITREGQVVTTYGQREFLPHIIEVLSVVGMR